MISKEQLESLIDFIKSKTGKRQEEISVEAGYEEKSLTQILSGKAKKDSAYKRLCLIYKDTLKDSTFLDVINISKSSKLSSKNEQNTKSNPALIVDKTYRLSDYVELLAKHNKFLQDTIESSLTAILQSTTSIHRHDLAYHQTMLRSAARQEKMKNQNSLIEEADRIEADLLISSAQKDTGVPDTHSKQ